MATLDLLRGDGALVMHLYTEIDGASATDGHLKWARDELVRYTAAGYQVEFVLRHRPASSDRDTAVRGYVRGVRQAVRMLAPNRGLIALQITNEPNLSGAPDAGDGAYPGVRRALVGGVIAADRELRKLGRTHVRVGFNVADSERGTRFWRDLRKLGGRRFARAVDWVGLDIYPGTWSAPAAVTPEAVRTAVVQAIKHMRRRALPRAGLGRRVKLVVSENGFPTGGGRTDADQVTVMEASIHAVNDVRRRYGVTDYRWFDLVDADSSSRHIEHQYGLLRDDGTPKEAFAAFAELIARLGAPGRSR